MTTGERDQLIGKRIRDSYGHAGTVTLALNGLDEACKHGLLGPTSAYAVAVGDKRDCHVAVNHWLHEQGRVPRTPRAGTWLAVAVDGGGQVTVGVDDVVEWLTSWNG